MKVWVVLAGQAYEGYEIQGIYESEDDAKKRELETLREHRYDFVKIEEDYVVRASTTRNALKPTCLSCGTKLENENADCACSTQDGVQFTDSELRNDKADALTRKLTGKE